MKHKKISDGFVLRLETGENLSNQVEQFIIEKNIRGGFIQGIGGVQKATVGYYNLQRKKYIFRAIKDAVELISLQGNIAWFNDLPIIHMHAVVSNKQHKAFGGHVQKIIVGATLEVRIVVSDELIRVPDGEVGLPVLSL